MLEEVGFVDVIIGPRVDTFGGAPGESKARAFGRLRLRIPRRQTTRHVVERSTLGGNCEASVHRHGRD
jgi:hypothetical protein